MRAGIDLDDLPGARAGQTYTFDAGWGDVTIGPGGRDNTILFGDGIARADVALHVAAYFTYEPEFHYVTGVSYGLVLQSGDDALRLATGNGRGLIDVGVVKFAVGSEIDLGGGLTLGSGYGTTAADTFVGTPANEFFVGNGGADTYTFARDFGHDAIGAVRPSGEYDAGRFLGRYERGDVIRFAEGIDASEVTARLEWRYSYDPHAQEIARQDLILTLGDSSLRILGFDRALGVRAAFADGTVKDFSGVLVLEDQGTILGTDGGDSIASRPESDILRGELGTDTYEFIGAFGDDTVSDHAWVLDEDYDYIRADPTGPNRLVFDAGVRFADLEFQRRGDDLVILAGADSVTIDAWAGLLFGNGPPIANPTMLLFADGSSFNIDNIRPGAWHYTYRGGAGDDSLVPVYGERNYIHGFAGDDTIRSQGNDDTLYGGLGDDVIDGHQGTFNGGDGADLITGGTVAIGGAGNDTISGSRSARGDLGNDSIAGVTDAWGGAGDDIIRAGRNAWGGEGDDRIAGAGTMYGEGGDDTLSGGSLSIGGDGDDSILAYRTMDGGWGDDTLQAVAGASRMLGGPGDDRISGGTAVDDVSGGLGNDWIAGYAGADRILGGSGNDSVAAGVGNDAAYGDAGNDVVSGGDGNDWLVGGDGLDTLSGGNGGDVLSGDTGNDVLRGDAGADTLVGGDGNDLLDGGYGGDSDRLGGGRGADVFRFAVDFGIDIVTDWDDTVEIRPDGRDRIDLSWFRAVNRNAPLGIDDLKIRDSGAHTFVELDLDHNGVADLVDLDRDGRKDAVRIILLDTAPAELQSFDFIF